MAKRESLLGRLARGAARALVDGARAALASLDAIVADRPEREEPIEAFRAGRPPPEPPPPPPPKPKPKRKRKTAAERRAELAAKAGPPPAEPPPETREVRHNLAFRWSGDRLMLAQYGLAEDILVSIETALESAGWDGTRIATMIIHYRPSYIVDVDGKHVASERAVQKSIIKVDKTLESHLNALLYFAASDDVDEIIGVDLILGTAARGRRPTPDGQEPPKKKRRKKATGSVPKESRETYLARQRKRKERAKKKPPGKRIKL